MPFHNHQMGKREKSDSMMFGEDENHQGHSYFLGGV